MVQCLDDILGFDREKFTALETQFKEIFPQIKSIKLIQEPAFGSTQNVGQSIPLLHTSPGKGLYFEFVNSSNLVPASQLSDGVLLLLAYLTLLYLPEPPRVILIEEPENGIHHKRLKDVLNIFVRMVMTQSHSQIIITTHSPYVVDQFDPTEVTLCKKDADGSVSVHRLSDSKAVRDQLDVFMLGEIWTGEGDDALAASAKEPA